jgi:serine/threonine protein kinase
MHDVAIKVVEDEEELSSQENEDIDPEVQFLQRVRHKNVVWFFGFGSLPSPFLVFEYMDQGDLSKWLWGQKQESRAWVTRIRLLRDAAAGMAYLHEKQHSIHRDLKSGNILLARTWCGVRARSARI